MPSSRISVATLLCLALAALLACPSARDGATEGGDTLVVGISDFPRQMDPRVGTDLAASRFHQLVYAGLVARDGQLRPVPDLAASWDRPDERTFVFHLREGLRFHDGRPLTSRDVAYTLSSTMDPELGSPRAADLERIEAIETPDDETVVIRLASPYAPFLQNLVYLGIVPEGADPATDEEHVGAGPFRYVAARRGESVELEAFEGYHRGRPGVDRLRLQVVGEATVRSMQLRKGSLDMIVMDLPPDLAAGFRDRDGFEVLSRPGISYSYLAVKVDDPVLGDPRVRRALAHGIDREAITEHLLQGFGEPASSLLPPWHWAHNPEAPDYAYDPAAARRLLDEAGYRDPDGEGGEPRLRLTYKTSTNQLARQQGAVIQQAWAEIGVEADLRTFEWGTFYEDLKEGNFQIAAARWVGIVDPDVYRLRLGSSYFPPAGLNRGHFADPELDDLLADGLRTYDEDERRRIYARVQEIVQSELPYIPLYYPETLAVLRDGVEGFELYPAGDFLPLWKVELASGP